MTEDELVRNPVEILAEDFLKRYRRGEHPSVTDYVARHPELSDEIREVFPAFLAIEEAKFHSAALGADRQLSTDANGLVPDRLGDFRIVREIGRGGMGVVYEAVQESLGRQVALKVLPVGALADPAALNRFHREARSVAALHHSNIVPVFGIGEHAGHHFFAMQLIRGQTLEAVLGGVRRLRDVAGPLPTMPLCPTERTATEIAGGLLTGQFTHATAYRSGEHGHAHATEPANSTGPINGSAAISGVHSASEISTVPVAGRGESQYHRRIARMGLQVAEALGYAHDQGVLHRDIKPSNLLMDEEGTVWVLDFGLARAEALAEQSASRDVVGTLRYMAPERFDGRSDRRSDVYGLGVTLYEMLTLQPAFSAPQQAALIHQVLHGAAKPARQVDRRIPRDLETIVAKAMSRDPSSRYASAHALGEDLRRFLENRTILARRSGALERTGRWCRRNPAVAVLLTSVVALSTFIAGYYSVSATRYRHQFERALAAELDGREKLFTSYGAQARASRFARRPGQRFAALRALGEAAKIHRTPELRDEAIACLALPDFEEIKRSPPVAGGILLTFDPSLERYARLDWDGVVSVRDVGDDREIKRFPAPRRNPSERVSSSLSVPTGATSPSPMRLARRDCSGFGASTAIYRSSRSMTPSAFSLRNSHPIACESRSDIPMARWSFTIWHPAMPMPAGRWALKSLASPSLPTERSSPSASTRVPRRIKICAVELRRGDQRNRAAREVRDRLGTRRRVACRRLRRRTDLSL